MSSIFKLNQNIFSRYQIPPRNTKSSKPFSTLKLDNPFLKQRLVPQNKQKAQAILVRSKCSSIQSRNIQAKNVYFQHHEYSKSQSVGKRSFTKSQKIYQQFIKQKDFEIERKRLAVFGAECLRYIRKSQQKNDINYKDTNNMAQKTNRINQIFCQSTNIYTDAKQPNNKNYNKSRLSEKQQKTSCKNKKLKKILSWNTTLQKQQQQNTEIPNNQNRNSLDFDYNQNNQREPTFCLYGKQKENKGKINLKNKNQDDYQKRSRKSDYIVQFNNQINIQKNQQSNQETEKFYSEKQDRLNYNNLQYSSDYFQRNPNKYTNLKCSDVFKSSKLSYNQENINMGFNKYLQSLNSFTKMENHQIAHLPKQIRFMGIRYQIIQFV